MLHNLLNFCGINIWQYNKDILPFIFEEIYFNPICIAILPIKKNILNDQVLYKDLQCLYHKMLTVLALPNQSLLRVKVYYEKKEDLINQKQDLTIKILKYLPQMILTFGILDIFDQDLLKNKGVLLQNTLHPKHLINYPQDKKIAYEDLLKVKDAIKNYTTPDNEILFR